VRGLENKLGLFIELAFGPGVRGLENKLGLFIELAFGPGVRGLENKLLFPEGPDKRGVLLEL